MASVGEAGAAEEGGVDAGRVGAFFDARLCLVVNAAHQRLVVDHQHPQAPPRLRRRVRVTVFQNER